MTNLKNEIIAEYNDIIRKANDLADYTLALFGTTLSIDHPGELLRLYEKAGDVRRAMDMTDDELKERVMKRAENTLSYLRSRGLCTEKTVEDIASGANRHNAFGYTYSRIRVLTPLYDNPEFWRSMKRVLEGDEVWIYAMEQTMRMYSLQTLMNLKPDEYNHKALMYIGEIYVFAFFYAVIGALTAMAEELTVYKDELEAMRKTKDEPDSDPGSVMDNGINV